MTRSGAKRTLEELANKSDPDDYDYSDHPVRTSRLGSKSNKKKKSKPPSKKKPRRDSDGDPESDDVLSALDELSFPDSDENEDSDVERNARGLARRKAARNRPVYKEDDSTGVDDEEEEGQEAKALPKSKGSNVITLKIGKAPKSQPVPDTFHGTRRSTRHNRNASEDMYALTNSGRHIQTIERGTRSPEVQAYRTRRGSKSQHTKSVIGEVDDEDTERAGSHEEQQEAPVEVSEEVPVEAPEEVPVEVHKDSQIEIMESDPQADFDEGSPAAENETGTNDEARMADVSIVPESEHGDARVEEDEDDERPTRRRRGRLNHERASEEAEQPEGRISEPHRSSRKKPAKTPQRKPQDDGSDFEPNDEDLEDDESRESEKSFVSPRKRSQPQDEDDDSSHGRRPGLRKRKSQSRGRGDSEAAVDIAEELAEELENLKGDRPRRRTRPEIIYEKPRRSRKDVDYRIIRPDLVLPIEEAEIESAESPSRRGRGAAGSWQRTLFSTYGPFGGGGPAAVLGPLGAPGATGGVESDSSDDEIMQNPKSAGGTGVAPTSATGPGVGLAGPAQTHGADSVQGPSGTPANFGKLKDKQALADADPLGIDPNVNFDSVGGLQGHIDQLKEMVSLPLLYPEIFQRFHIVPPRGVLFHGPPGTGKTLMARALASSVSSEGRKVTFYMRKGADALSKWVGEAERQLRLLFEEARKTQPSIIFFDEIDGLAPVRSSKQEQIHASIVSTLLALMDGMDGRGQVIVIGATNRPDSIDPALRRPGRFDREFYFPLPNKEGRRAILDIHTQGWDPPLPDDIKDELAEITKGYGGADIRALCTEAALNAVQRKYPQIYKSSKKLLIDPKKIEVTPKDFMMSVKKIVPSSERATSSSASPLPSIVEPLLRHPLAEIKKLISEIFPPRKRLTALEEAQFEEPEGSEGFKRERMQQEFETSRIFRPRILVWGAQGMGQQYLAAAVLHHFEGIFVQSFDLSTLMGDSTRSPEATVVQLFVEVKRHKPSVIYIPNIQVWYATVGQMVISTFLGLLRSIPPTDPILLLGVLEEEAEIDTEMLKRLFGFSKKSRYSLEPPRNLWRHEFFAKLIDYVKTSPAEFPDPENRKKRKLETLEVAPPPPSKPAAPVTKEQLKAQKKKDHQTLNLLKVRIQPIMDQIKKYKRFRTGVIDESQIRYLFDEDDPQIVTSDLPLEQRTTFRPFEKDLDKHGVPGLREAVSGKFYYNLEIVTIEKRLSNGYYKRPKDFIADIKRLAKDARQLRDQERILRANELLSNVEVDIATIEQTDPGLVAECENVYLRELDREKAIIERAKRAEEADSIMAPPPLTNVPHGNTDSSVSSGPIVLGQPIFNNRTNMPPRPIVPARPSTVSFMTNGFHGGSGSDLNEGAVRTTSNGSHATRGDIEGDTYMTNSDDVDSGGRDTMNSSFGPSAQPKPLLSHTAPSQQIRRQSGISSLSQRGPMTPMAPGSQPGDYANDASTTQSTSDKRTSDQSTGPQHQIQSPAAGSRTEYPDLTLYPDRISHEELLPDTQQEFAYSQNSMPNGSQSQPRSHLQHGSQQPPVPPFDTPAKQHSHQHTNIQSLLNNEDTPPNLAVDHQLVEQLHSQLTQRTSGCSVEQLEQINTHLMDCLWNMRGEWNRNRVVVAVKDTFNEVLDDMQSTQEFESISQRTKEQLGASSFHV